MQIDGTDWRILCNLQQDGRLSNQDLADKVALSPSACLRRVRALEDSGLIQSYHAKLDAKQLGFELDAMVQVTIDCSRERWHDDFAERIKELEEVVAAYVVTGEFNYILHVRTQNLTAFSHFVINKLHKLPGIQEICSHIVMQTVKDYAGQLPLSLKR